jgi:hypothetical protein
MSVVVDGSQASILQRLDGVSGPNAQVWGHTTIYALRRLLAFAKKARF